MPLCTPSSILAAARAQNRLAAAFNVGNMEMLWGVMQAAEETGTPLILQIAEKRLPHSPLTLLGPMMVNAAKRAGIPAAVQLDHGFSFRVIEETLSYGFTGIMFDGSAYPLEKNISETQKAARLCREAGASLEAELGVLAGSEGGDEHEALYTCPQDAERFARETGCDALAVSIGNAHGHYVGEPKLNFQVLSEIHRLTDIPLVLHGGSGIPIEDLTRAASLGVCKVNIATANFDALARGALIAAKQPGVCDYFTLSAAMVRAVSENTRKHIHMFGG